MTYGNNSNCYFKNGNLSSVLFCRLGYELISQDLTNLTSTIKLRLECISTDSNYGTYGATRYSTIDNTRVADATFDMRSTNVWQNFGERTITVGHNPDGTYNSSKSASFNTSVINDPVFNGWSLYSGQCSVNITLPTISTNNIKIKVSDTWKNGKVYVNVNGTWKEGTPYVNINGSWKKAS